MSFMAVAYVPAFLEDRANFAKERANGLYGATPFMISNFLIGLPFLCESYRCFHILESTNRLSPYIDAFLHCVLLAFQFSSRWRSLHDLGDVDLPGSSGSRVPRRSRDGDISKFCHLPSTSRLC